RSGGTAGDQSQGGEHSLFARPATAEGDGLGVLAAQQRVIHAVVRGLGVILRVKEERLIRGKPRVEIGHAPDRDGAAAGLREAPKKDVVVDLSLDLPALHL